LNINNEKIFHEVGLNNLIGDIILYDNKNDVLFSYELISIIVHIGKEIQGGHYICYSKYINHSRPDDWYKFNDTKVELINVKEIYFGTDDSTLPYIFFYKRREVEN
jgi:uncharacterized UBP type Zn finger protein